MVIGDISFEEFVRLIDDVYDEIFIWDEQMRVVYANKACYRHYGVSPEEFIGKKLEEFTEHDKLWSPTIVPRTFLQKKPMIQRQKTLLGMDIVTISVQQLPESFFSIDNIDTRKWFVGGSLEEEIDSFTADLVRRTYESHPSSRKLAEALSISQTKANRLIAKYITAK